MSKNDFADSAWVEIQGARALHFVGRKKKYAEYEVIGYSDQIILRDYRRSGLNAIDEVRTTGNADKFASQFNAPSLVKIPNLEAHPLAIELFDTENADPAIRLWIAVGTTELPNYDFIHRRIVEFSDAFALVALYHRNMEPQLSPSSGASEFV